MTKRSTIGMFVIIAICFAIGLLLHNKISIKRSKVVAFNNIPIVNAALYDSTSKYYLNFKSIDKDIHLLPIAIMAEDTLQFSMLEQMNNLDVFDNITGQKTSDGIVDFAGEKFIFFADMAHTPYTGFSGENLRDLVIKNAISLIQDKETRPKIMIVNDPLACAYGAKDLNVMLKQSKSGIKAISIIDATVSQLFEQIDTTSTVPFSIGIIGSDEVLRSNGFQKAIREEIINRGIVTDIQLIEQHFVSDSTMLRYVDPELGIVTKTQYNLTAIDSLFAKREKMADQTPYDMKAIIITDSQYYDFAADYADRVNVPCPIIYPELCVAAECYRTLREDSNLSMRITRKSQQIYFSVADYDGTTQNVCINQL